MNTKNTLVGALLALVPATALAALVQITNITANWFNADPGSATTRPGDLWLLGRHRLLCGDSRNAQAFD